MNRRTLPVALTIAGSDSGGGAGIQADLKTFDAFGVHGLSALAAVTAQHTRGVTAVHAVPPRILRAQIDAVFDDFFIGAVKIGMLGTAAAVREVALALTVHRPRVVVLDPVMVATSGARLLAPAAVDALVKRLLPLATIVTPNLPEAEALTGRRLRREADFDAAAADLRAAGAGAVLLKGGHGRGQRVIDRLYLGDERRDFVHRRLAVEGHGTGCSLAAAIAAGMACGHDIGEAADMAIGFVQRALAAGYRPGRGRVRVLAHARARTQVHGGRD